MAQMKYTISTLAAGEKRTVMGTVEHFGGSFRGHLHCGHRDESASCALRRVVTFQQSRARVSRFSESKIPVRLHSSAETVALLLPRTSIVPLESLSMHRGTSTFLTSSIIEFAKSRQTATFTPSPGQERQATEETMAQPWRQNSPIPWESPSMRTAMYTLRIARTIGSVRSA